LLFSPFIFFSPPLPSTKFTYCFFFSFFAFCAFPHLPLHMYRVVYVYQWRPYAQTPPRMLAVCGCGLWGVWGNVTVRSDLGCRTSPRVTADSRVWASLVMPIYSLQQYSIWRFYCVRAYCMDGCI
jgi:hypothetical protein